MTREDAHNLIDKLFDNELILDGLASGELKVGVVGDSLARVLPEGRKVVRTKSSGDRVYMLNEDAKTKQWVTNADVLEKLGFSLEDVSEVEDDVLMGYAMGAAIYKVDSEQA